MMATEGSGSTPKIRDSGRETTAWLGNAAKHQTPDAFVAVGISFFVLACSATGFIDYRWAITFGLVMGAGYFGISCVRMRHEQRLKIAELDAKSGVGEQIPQTRSRKAKSA